MIECRLLIDPPGPGAWNMAVDEMLLEGSAEQRACCLRFYRWQEPTLSLGYFQERQDRAGHGPSRDCPVVRRLTGGGAILHDAELTYSLVVHGGHPLASRRDALYQAAHGSLIEALADLGIAAAWCQPSGDHPPVPRLFQPCGSCADVVNPGTADTAVARIPAVGNRAMDNPPSGSRCGREPFLCFQRRTAGDVLVGRTKIAGSAQRRRRGAVLQHGSVLLRRSPAAPELPALEDAAGKTVEAEQLAERWLERLAPRLAVVWMPGVRTPAEELRAAELVHRRYGSAAWTECCGRSSP
jgi:lipoate-protein ligase A